MRALPACVLPIASEGRPGLKAKQIAVWAAAFIWWVVVALIGLAAAAPDCWAAVRRLAVLELRGGRWSLRRKRPTSRTGRGV